MRKFLAVLILPLLASACGTTVGDRALSGAGIGAGVGVVAGPIGVSAGALVGGAVGAITKRDEFYLGRPIWDR